MEFLSLRGGCTGWSESTQCHVKMPHCWKSHAMAHVFKRVILWKQVIHQGTGSVDYTSSLGQTRLFQPSRPHQCGSRGRGTWGPDPPPPLKSHIYIGSFRNTGRDLLNNHKATVPTFNVGPSSARQ